MKKGIRNYVEYLKREHSFEISFYNGTKPGNKILNDLLLYSLHTNPYCIYIKSSRKRHRQCISFLNSIQKRCDEEIFEVECMCGVKQYILPIRYGADLFGFICVGSAKGGRGTVERYAEQNGIDKDELLYKFDNFLEQKPYDKKLVLTLVKPLAAMITVLFLQSPMVDKSKGNNLYESILYELHNNTKSRKTIADIAEACHCSTSTVSHVFKKNSGTTISRYLNDLRFHSAKHLITSTDMSITEIAYTCGFSDANYFISFFSKEMGMPPLKYRKLYHKENK